MSFTLSDFQPHRHQIRGRRGDGIPATEIVFQFGYPEAVDKDDFSVLCQLRDSAGALVHTFVPVLQDNDDDTDIGEFFLEVRLPQITSAESTLLVDDEYYGDLQITKAGEEPLTVVVLSLNVLKDFSR